MADILIDRWRLSVLRVRLDLSGTPLVHSELTAYPQGEPEVLVERRDAPEAYGIPSWSRGDGTLDLTVPVDLVDEVRAALHDHLGPMAALWIHLLEPRGHLGGVPWEASFAAALDAPVLRVPNRLPIRTVPQGTYRIAVLASAAEPERIAEPLLGTIERLRQTVPVDVDLFTDVGTRAALEDAVGPPSDWLRVQDPESAYGCYERWWRDRLHRPATSKIAPSAMPVPGPADIWAAWIAERVGDRATTALHVFTDGRLDGDRGLVTVATRPTEPVDRSTTGYLFPDDVATIADRAGAETIAITSLPGDPSELGVRLFADVLGVNRPGPTIFISAGHDPDGWAAAAAHRFLADPDAPLPVHPGIFAYLQPGRVRHTVDPDYAPTLLEDAATTQRSWEDAGWTDSGWDDAVAVDVPAWVDPAQRYIDRSLAELTVDEDVVVTKSATKAGYDDGRETALRDLQDIIKRHGGSS